MPKRNPRREPWARYAWIEAIDDRCVFVATSDSLAAFRVPALPDNWMAQLESPAGNLVIACEVDLHGSAAGAAYASVARLDWPIAGRRIATRPPRQAPPHPDRDRPTARHVARIATPT